MDTNLSEEKRRALLAQLHLLRSYVASASDRRGDLLAAIAQLEEAVGAPRYGLVYERHREAAEALGEAVLREEPALAIPGATAHCLIEGENLAALKILESTCKGKIDVIYIDPPYNRGKGDFAYSDRYRSSGDCFRHSKWASFMEKRLATARRLMAPQGSIFLSIGDQELAVLRLLCDEIFGEGAFVACIPRVTKLQRSAQERYVDVSHDYVLCYSYAGGFARITPREIDLRRLRTDHIGRYLENDTKAILADKSKGYSPGGDYDFLYNGKLYQPVDSRGVRNRWLWTRERMQAAADLGILVETQNSLRMQLYLDYKFDEKTNTMVPRTADLVFHTGDFMTDSAYTNAAGSRELRSLGEDLFRRFNSPKPVRLIADLIAMAGGRNALVLDFFAGSGTTGQAVLALNAADGGHRRCILCTNNENGICREVAYERLRRVIAREGYSDGLRYYLVES